MDMKIPEGYKNNFETLKRAFAAGHVALLSCVNKADNTPATLLCAMNGDLPTGEIEFVPFAMMLSDPYAQFDPALNEGATDD